MRYALLLGLLLGLCGCGPIAAMMGYIPAEQVPGAGDGLTLAEAAGLTGASVPVSIVLTYIIRNLTAVSRAKSVLGKLGVDPKKA